ncbi:MAG: 16S rRNA (uracil(1498)-N(3))-methyltransferase [Clostridiales bacterium]|jgi:16S rRNA (uracil1498-N3)-methyltransferase|nr:16S rRNA (uracil(1498)-N(3))-methyltransferase [Clostridiales bacterium]HOB64379.1 RsmE family RNA methyltransferase [Clostridia bacterium]HOK81309.1 RsmE family RNA methyltransferase [Clostridia bacterium]HOL60428.1 RsmE family RNA methyltransferase [Clostridia bacterium]HPO53185.1 RsmE family RNA methyltransferase [Clostridia bacterium]
MEIKRFFCDRIDGDKVILTGEEFHHCVKVTRHKAGFTIIVCIGDGYDYYAKIESVEKESLTAKIFRKEINKNEVSGSLIFFQGVCKELDFIVQKAVELGATRIVPFYSINTNISGIKQDRLQKIVREAAKQCGRARLPDICEPVNFDKAIEISRAAENRVLCYENCRGKTIKDAVAKNSHTLALFVGAEGGFTETEVAYAQEKGVQIVTLGKRILRAETAAVAAMTLGLAALGEL